MKHGNIFYTIMSAVTWFGFILMHLIEIHAHSYWAVGWMSFTMHTLVLMDIRTKARGRKNIPGNMVEDFFACWLFHGGVLTQLEADDNWDSTAMKSA